LNCDLFLAYCRAKSEVYRRLEKLYCDELFLRLRAKADTGRQISEAKFISDFKKKFGDGSETIVAIGNWSRNGGLRGVESVKGKGFRAMFRRAGYFVALVDEFRTSCRCYGCQKENEKFAKQTCKKPGARFGMEIECHGLLRCTECHTIWNRDVNGACNIWLIAVSEIYGQGRPDYLKRTPRQVVAAATAAVAPTTARKRKAP
jgi:hypothetical protein